VYLLEIKEDPDCNAECNERHGVSNEVQSGRHFHSCLSLTFKRHIGTRLIIRVVGPCAIAVAESASILCKEKQGISGAPAAVQYERRVTTGNNNLSSFLNN
jgi:hypothetical protein